jgi:hypothetical protein
VKRKWRIAVVAVFALIPVLGARALSPAAAIAFQPTQQDAHEHSQASPAPKAGQMMPMGADMMAQMKTANDRLNALVVKMNEAAGDAKVAAMADLLTALVNERRDMQAMMARCSMMK